MQSVCDNMMINAYNSIAIQVHKNQTHPEQKLVNFSSNSDINLISKRHKCSTTMLLFIYLFIFWVGNQLSRVPHCKETQTTQADWDWLLAFQGL